MQFRMIRPLLAFVLTLGVCGAASAQNVLRLPGNKTVEVVGLEDWTLPMLQDSLRKYAEGVTLDSHACAETLRFQLGFPMASATRYRRQGVPGEHVLVSVVEPADSARVRRRNIGNDTLAVRPEWREMAAVIRARPVALELALQLPGNIPDAFAADSAAIRRIWTFLDTQDPPHVRTAIEVLGSDAGVQNRVIAALILSARGGDAAWHALVPALLDDNDLVAGVAGLALGRASVRRSSSAVDWAPIAADVHALLEGSNLFELARVMDALVAAEVDGRWAAPFLAGGAHAVLARLRAEDERVWRPAHQLLVALRGEDLGRDAAAWQAWIDSLGAAPRGGE